MNRFKYRILIFLNWAMVMGTPISYSQSNTYDPLNSYQFNRKNYFKNNGKTDQSPWFEWWYYKIVLPEKNKSFFFVYGVVNPWDQSETLPGTRALLRAGSFGSNLILEKRFSIPDFKASYTTTNVSLGNNIATDKRLTGSFITQDGYLADWDIVIDKKWAFNAASWVTGKNITNIEWYPAQADARCSGKVIINAEVESFVNAPCYQDRNWGSLFPEWWTWIVSNHFENHPETALVVGGGKPTIFDYYSGIESVAIGLKHKNQTYKWRPHEGDFIKIQIRFGHWEVDAVNKTNRIKIKAFAPKEKFMDLQFMTPQGKYYHDYEALNGDLEVELYEKSSNKLSWNLIDTLTSHQAGIEYGSYKTLDSTLTNSLNLCLVGCEKNP